MKDFRSLETKIRQLMEGKLLEGGWEKITESTWHHRIAEVTRFDIDGVISYVNSAGQPVEIVEDNTAKRRSEPNVGRPNTAKSPTDPRSKLLKQAEIKTKIIDETKRILDLIEKQQFKKPAKKDDKKPDPKDKKDDKDTDKKQTTPKDKGSNKSPTTKAEDDHFDREFKKDAKKEKDGSIDDDKNPKQLEGGKTQVDTHPTTDDNLTDDTREKKQGDTEAKKENKKIGQKGANKKQKDKADVKEELFSEEELAHFELVEAEEKKRKSAADKKAGRFVDMSKKNVDQIINEKGKPHKVYTGTDETRHALGIDELIGHLGVGDSPYIMKKFMHNLHTLGVRTGWSHSAGKHIAYHGKKI